MGCDIHMLAERRNKKGKWEEVGAVFKNTYAKDKLTHEPYSGRNYELFTFLANVRNRFDIVPIAEQKGFPSDASDYVKENLIDFWDGDGHGASWYTLKELQEANWEQTYEKSGVIPADVYEYLKSTSDTPQIYSQGVTGNGIKTVTQEEWECMNWSLKTNGTRWYVRMHWSESVKDSCQFFVEETIPALEKLGNPDEVRIVFNFDN